MANYQSSLTGQQIEDVLTGIHGVSGVVMRVNDTTYRAADADDVNAVSLDAQTLTEEQKTQVRENIGADDFVAEAPNDGQQYARKNKAWAVVQSGAGTGDHTELSNRDAANQHPISAITGLPSALELVNKLLALLAKLTKGQAWDTEAGATPAYIQTVPAGGKAVAVKSIGGHTAAMKQLLHHADADYWAGSTGIVEPVFGADNSITCTILGRDTADKLIKSKNTESIVEGHVYLIDIEYSFTLDSGTLSYVRVQIYQDGSNRINLQQKSETSGRYTVRFSATKNLEASTRFVVGVDAGITGTITLKNPMLFDLTYMFGAGNEPSTVEECKAIFPNDYYPYNVGELVSANVVSVDSTDSDSTTLGTLAIPAEVRALEGYGQSNGSDYNYLDLEAKKYVEVGHYVNGVWTAHAQEIDVSAYIGDDNLLVVEGGGKLTFTQSGASINVPVPNDTEYAINLSEATANGPLFASAPYMGGTPPTAPYYEPEIDGVADDT